MKFGINFFPTVGPDEKTGAEFYDECFDLCALADELGYSHAKTVEHYFFEWGGYSPDPVVFLAGAAMRTKRIRLVTGAVIPAFSHPIQLAGKLAMLDNICHGRLDVGFARAFLPEEFEAFETPMDESRPRFEENIAALKKLWTEEGFRWEGKFHKFGPLPRLLPHPFQTPHPPLFVACIFNPQSFDWAAKNGLNIMIVPYVSTHENVKKLLSLYRNQWVASGHTAGQEQIHVSYHCYLAEDRDEAIRGGQKLFNDYKAKQLKAVAGWKNTKSDQYPGYENIQEEIKKGTFEQALANDKVFVGTPKDVIRQIEVVSGHYGANIEPSLQVNFGNSPKQDSVRTMTLFAQKVMPNFR